MASPSFYQAVNFLFNVAFTSNSEGPDVRFQSVTGLDSTIETETIKEGGENRFEHVIPVRRKYGPLILKRGILRPADVEKNTWSITRWLQDAFEHEIINPVPSVTINLLNEDHTSSLITWTISNVWPRSWKIGELNAEQGAVLIETLELNYNVLVMDSTDTKRSVEAATEANTPNRS
jgi:phage tail-like protein